MGGPTELSCLGHTGDGGGAMSAADKTESIEGA